MNWIRGVRHGATTGGEGGRGIGQGRRSETALASRLAPGSSNEWNLRPRRATGITQSALALIHAALTPIWSIDFGRAETWYADRWVRKPPFLPPLQSISPLINPVIYLMNVNQAEFYAVDISARPKPIVFPARALKRATGKAKGTGGEGAGEAGVPRSFALVSYWFHYS
jgi:hypothetical protein